MHPIRYSENQKITKFTKTSSENENGEINSRKNKFLQDLPARRFGPLLGYIQNCFNSGVHEISKRKLENQNIKRPG